VSLRRPCLLLAGLLLGLAPVVAPRAAEIDPWVRARTLLEAGQPRQAVDLLKGLDPARHDDGRLAVLQARGYLALDNRPWARRVLLERLQAVPGDCQARAWLAWVLLGAADLPAARALLAEGDCPALTPAGARLALLAALVEREAGHAPEARAHARTAHQSPSLFVEDRALLQDLSRSLWPARPDPLEVRADLRGGWSSNPVLGSPADLERRSGVAGAFGDLALVGRVAWPWLTLVQPFAEAELKAQANSSQAAQDLDYLYLSGRPGVVLDLGGLGLLAAWRLDALLLRGGDAYQGGPLWYFLGQRGEAEAWLGPYLTLLGGVGWRQFRPLGRSRVEGDLGLGAGGPLGGRLHLMGVLSLRLQRATNSEWNRLGGLAAATGQVRLPGAWAAKADASLALEDFPDSAGVALPAGRRDWLLKGRLGLWSPAWAGVRLGLEYEPSHRRSSAEAYTFTDHRVGLHLRWVAGGDPWLPEGVGGEGREVLDYGVGGGAGGALGERLQDLLRQDEESRRGSSCVD
jgi:hypothetical protein